MRNAFANEITNLADNDDRVVLLSGDIGNRLFNDFKDRFPSRFFNCGIAEANMMSVAAGMAMCGMRPFVYTITPFATTRCLEQIRVDVCYHQLPVTIIGVGAGLSYASLGPTHHSCEDIAFLRVLPNMNVICPADSVEVRLSIRACLQQKWPSYIRIGKKGEPVVHINEPKFTIGKSITIRKGTSICILSCGSMLPEALKAADFLLELGISTGVESFHTVKPLDAKTLTDAFAMHDIVATVEEHGRMGGLGGAVAEWASDQEQTKARLVRFGTEDHFMHEAGSQTYARSHYQISAQHIVDKLRKIHFAKQ